MLRIVYTAIVLLSLISSIHAQQYLDSLKGYITRENTDIKFINAKTSVFDVLISQSRMTFSGGLGGKFYYNGFYLNANYTYHYADNLAEVVGTPLIGGNSIYQNTKSRDADATLGYFFQKKTKGEVKIKISGSRVGRMNVDHYAKVIANYNKLLGLQVGYKQGFSNLTIPEGIIVRDVYINPNNDIKTNTGLNTYMEYGWFSFGATFGKTIDVAVNLEKYGAKKAQYLSRFYVNLLMSRFSKLEDVYFKDYYSYPNMTVHNQYILNGNVNMSNVGFNVGWETTNFNKIGIIYGTELGIMPGVKVTNAGNFYLSLKWGIIFGKAF